jgi:peptidoglycan/LPS O-acetylase OafA/YrhL
MKFFSIVDQNNRVFGLDLLRFLAIFYVVLGHSKILLPDSYDGVIDDLLIDGVSIFFVLSGYLIGGILIRKLDKEKPSLRFLLNFWSRRWLRTLPVYLVVLTFIITYTYLLKPTRLPDDWWKYYLFIQNFNSPQPAFFSEAWSLSIEEWFYLLLPLVLFPTMLLLRENRKLGFGLVITFGIAAVVIYRMVLYKSGILQTNSEVDLLVMRQVLTRLDAIMFGVLGAYIHYYFPVLWNKAGMTTCVIAFVSLYVFKHFNASNLSQHFIVFLPAYKSISVLLMLPFLSSWKKMTWKIGRAITFISLISYSIYLINRTLVIDCLFKYMVHDNLKKKHVLTENWLLEYLLFWVIVVLLAYLLYIFVERPFMQMRKKER